MEPTAPSPVIIGYKCPMDLFKGDIQKDYIYVAHPVTNGMYYPQLRPQNQIYWLPTEIVETWDAVYGATEKTFHIQGKTILVTDEDIYIDDTPSNKQPYLDWVCSQLPDAKASEIKEIFDHARLMKLIKNG